MTLLQILKVFFVNNDHDQVLSYKDDLLFIESQPVCQQEQISGHEKENIPLRNNFQIILNITAAKPLLDIDISFTHWKRSNKTGMEILPVASV